METKYIVLGVAFDWGLRKGLDVFIWLAGNLPVEYKIVLVGTNDEIDSVLPPTILSIHRTQNQKELALIYSAADIFVNPTREESFSTTNIEALACGTPVVTFNTGGSPEMLSDQCGKVVKCEDLESLKSEIMYICENAHFKNENCRKQAEQYDMNRCFEKYVELFS